MESIEAKRKYEPKAKNFPLKWADVSDPVSTILERVDISGKGMRLEIGSMIDLQYFKGIFTKELAEEILHYQHSTDNAGYFSASLEGNVLTITFLKRAF
jgi:hypothetical protein